MEGSTETQTRESGKRYTFEEEMLLQKAEEAAGKQPLMGMGGSQNAALQEQKDKQWAEGSAAIEANAKNSFDDHAFGSMLGAFAADSCGSFLEFHESTATKQEMMQCKEMMGGGPHKVAGGQVTDDSEMAMSLLNAIVEMNEKVEPGADQNIFNFETVGYQYYEWYDSEPFDIGETTQRAVSRLEMGAQAAYQTTRKYNQGKSNGSLMRCTPLAIWGAELENLKEYQVMYTMVGADVKFVHCNPVVIDSCYLYELAIAHLLNNPTSENRCRDAFDLAMEQSQSELANHVDSDYGESCKKWLIEAEDYFNKSIAQSDPKQNYMMNMETRENPYNVIPQMGFIKHAFILSFYYLLRAAEKEKLNPKEFSYSESIFEIISMGGDTDTNACIAGGMIGAVLGAKGIDYRMLKTLISVDVTKEGQRRPVELSVGRTAIKQLKELIKRRVTKGIKYEECPDGKLS